MPGVWAAPMQRLPRRMHRLSESDYDTPVQLRSSRSPTLNSRRMLQIHGDKAGIVVQTKTRSKDRAEMPEKAEFHRDGGRRVGATCGNEDGGCICHEDFCCSAPTAVRSSFQNYNDEWETMTGSTAKVICRNGICNVTLDKVPAPGCADFDCLHAVCEGGVGACSVFTPELCSTCNR